MMHLCSSLQTAAWFLGIYLRSSQIPFPKHRPCTNEVMEVT
jgi:hypothetical protein